MPQTQEQAILEAFYQAARSGESLQKLLDQYKLDTKENQSRLHLNKTYQGITPLWIATQKGQLHTVKYLFNIGASRTSCILSYRQWQWIIDEEENPVKKQGIRTLLMHKQQAGDPTTAIAITPLEIAYAMQDQNLINLFNSNANFPLLRSFEALAKHLHYVAPTEPFCHGFAFKWLTAVMLRQEAIFHQRLHHIEHHEAQVLCEHLANAQERVKARESLTSTEQTLLEIPAFYDSIFIAQNPFNYRAIFSEPLSQNNLLKLSAYTNSLEIEAQGGLTIIHESAFIYTESEIQEYLHQIGQLIQSEAPLPSPVGLLLTSHDHSIALSISGAFWKFMDVNYYPSTLHELNDTANLAKRIKQSFSPNREDYTAFNTTVLYIGYPEIQEKLRKAFGRLQSQEAYAITSSIAERFGNTNIAYLAAMHGHDDTIIQLSRLRANLNKPSDLLTPLQIAAQNGHWSTLSILIAEGANPLIKHQDTGFTLLHMAAKYGQADGIRILIDLYSLDLDASSYEGMTAACLAAQQGHLDVLFELVQLGANFNRYNHAGLRPVCFAAAQGDVLMIEKLAQWGINLDVTEPGKPTPMSEAATHNQLDVLKKLLQLGVNPSATLRDGSTPAHLAAQYGHAEVIKFFIAAGVSVADPRNDGQTPAHVAAEHGHANVIEALANAVNINTISITDDTPLSLALKHKHTHVIAALHACHADFNLPIPLHLSLIINVSPLFYAIRIRDIKTLTYLLEHHLVTDTRGIFSIHELQNLLADVCCPSEIQQFIDFKKPLSADGRIIMSPQEFAYLHAEAFYSTITSPIERLLNVFIPSEESLFAAKIRAADQESQKQFAYDELIKILTPPTYNRYQTLFHQAQIKQTRRVFGLLRQALSNNVEQPHQLTLDDLSMLHQGNVGHQLREFISSGLARILVAPRDVSNIHDLLAIILHRPLALEMSSSSVDHVAGSNS